MTHPQQNITTQTQNSDPLQVTDNLAAILERANRKLQEEIVPIDNLTHSQAILEQRLRLVDEALKKLSKQQLRLGIDNIPRHDLLHLLKSANLPHSVSDSEEDLRKRVNDFLSTL